jgi:hypothetical protein
MNYTPGPWKIFDGWGSSRFSPAIVDSIPDVDGKCVANCICHVASTNESVEANAHLIAAAPDLLEACIAGKRYGVALAQFGDKVGQIIESDDLDKLFEDWANKTETAICKAKGQTNAN